MCVPVLQGKDNELSDECREHLKASSFDKP